MNILDKFIEFVREQKPEMVNHGEKINLFELERLVSKFSDEIDLDNDDYDEEDVMNMMFPDAENEDDLIFKDLEDFQ